MKELDNVTILCAKRSDALMQIYKGQVTVHVYRGMGREVFHADWKDEKSLQGIIHALNHGAYACQAKMPFDNLTVAHNIAPTPIECFIVVHTSNAHEVDAHAFWSRDEAVDFVQQDAERVLTEFDRLKPVLLTKNWDDTEVFIPYSDVNDMWHIISKDI